MRPLKYFFALAGTLMIFTDNPAALFLGIVCFVAIWMINDTELEEQHNKFLENDLYERMY